jgi:hypothetical protein
LGKCVLCYSSVSSTNWWKKEANGVVDIKYVKFKNGGGVKNINLVGEHVSEVYK